ncbi:DUF2812 domain-containing protein [Alteribacillus iranensis]|uniref:DUF2812 domain-containing protein n=1 Tax=Alteribacillus iranensis TaxID=930128 RepID=A0A1I2D1R4_9BACI|nr:DUF2812 domain-containing protein [Alteribacillus iranensis]SFE74444.1 Protein of unknown function [Alteribacillus iranensis]
MKETKYVGSWGLAFAEDFEMRKLAKLAKKGWLLEKIGAFGYKLRRGEKQHIQYAIDYQVHPEEEYFTYFEEAGWSHVASLGEIHFFTAPEGTIPLYTDHASHIKKYETEKKKMGTIAYPAFILTILLFLCDMLFRSSSMIFANISVTLGVILIPVLVFTGMPYVAYTIKLYQMRKYSTDGRMDG